MEEKEMFNFVSGICKERNEIVELVILAMGA
jgi:hypothetical protein